MLLHDRSSPIRDRFTALSPLNERDRRLFAATEAAAAAYGGIAAVSAATGIAVNTIGRGIWPSQAVRWQVGYGVRATEHAKERADGWVSVGMNHDTSAFAPVDQLAGSRLGVIEQGPQRLALCFCGVIGSAP